MFSSGEVQSGGTVSKIEREPQECNLLSHSLQLLQRIACWQCDFSVNISLILYYYKISLTWCLGSQFWCLCAGDSHGITFLSSHLNLINAISQECLEEFHYIWHKRPLGLKDELTGIWWSKVKVTVASQKIHNNQNNAAFLFSSIDTFINPSKSLQPNVMTFKKKCPILIPTFQLTAFMIQTNLVSEPITAKK